MSKKKLAEGWRWIYPKGTGRAYVLCERTGEFTPEAPPEAWAEPEPERSCATCGRAKDLAKPRCMDCAVSVQPRYPYWRPKVAPAPPQSEPPQPEPKYDIGQPVTVTTLDDECGIVQDRWFESTIGVWTYRIEGIGDVDEQELEPAPAPAPPRPEPKYQEGQWANLSTSTPEQPSAPCRIMGRWWANGAWWYDFEDDPGCGWAESEIEPCAPVLTEWQQKLQPQHARVISVPVDHHGLPMAAEHTDARMAGKVVTIVHAGKPGLVSEAVQTSGGELLWAWNLEPVEECGK